LLYSLYIYPNLAFPLTLILAARAGKNFQTCKDSQSSCNELKYEKNM
jgi:hypothetical protein